MNTITPQELKTKLENNTSLQLIDIREDYEFEEYNIGGINIPMDQVFSSLDKIDTNKQVVLCCNSGKKSSAILHTINRKLKLDNIYSLKSGITGYREEFV